MSPGRKDVVAGLLFIALGGAFCIHAVRSLRLGTVFQMGPGYFPMLLGAALVFLGILVAMRARKDSTSAPLRIPLRALVLLPLAPVLFGLTVRGLGLLPASLICAFLAASANPTASLTQRAAIALGLTVFSIGVFSFGLGLSYPLFGTWVRS